MKKIFTQFVVILFLIVVASVLFTISKNSERESMVQASEQPSVDTALPEEVIGDNTQDTLGVDKSSGTAPLTVTLLTPKEVKKKMEECKYSLGWFGTSGNGLNVDWGDGVYSPDSKKPVSEHGVKSCTKEVMKHTYTVPGTYTIEVRSWHPGPTDAPVIDWIGEVTVNVLSANTQGARSATSIKLLSPSAGDMYSYQKYPNVKWNVHPSKNSQIRLSLVSKGGAVIKEQVIDNVSYIGVGEASLRAVNDAYDNELLSGESQFKVVAKLMDGEIVLASDESSWFTMTAEQKFRGIRNQFILNQEKVVVPFNIVAKYNANHPDALNYKLDWGDSTAPSVSETHFNVQSSLLDSQLINLGTHTYKKPGVYFLKLKVADMGGALNKVPSYIMKKVEVFSKVEAKHMCVNDDVVYEEGDERALCGTVYRVVSNLATICRDWAPSYNEGAQVGPTETCRSGKWVKVTD